MTGWFVAAEKSGSVENINDYYSAFDCVTQQEQEEISLDGLYINPKKEDVNYLSTTANNVLGKCFSKLSFSLNFVLHHWSKRFEIAWLGKGLDLKKGI